MENLINKFIKFNTDIKNYNEIDELTLDLFENKFNNIYPYDTEEFINNESKIYFY